MFENYMHAIQRHNEVKLILHKVQYLAFVSNTKLPELYCFYLPAKRHLCYAEASQAFPCFDVCLRVQSRYLMGVDMDKDFEITYHGNISHFCSSLTACSE
jgi:hypothetical protein